jgi:hypothetical protein
MDITEIVTLILKLVLVLATTFLIPWVKKKVDAEKLTEVRKWTMIAVEAAEMIYNGFEMGEAKKAFVEDFLKRKGFNLNTDEVDKLIEAAVLEMNNALWG